MALGCDHSWVSKAEGGERCFKCGDDKVEGDFAAEQLPGSPEQVVMRWVSTVHFLLQRVANNEPIMARHRKVAGSLSDQESMELLTMALAALNRDRGGKRAEQDLQGGRPEPQLRVLPPGVPEMGGADLPVPPDVSELRGPCPRGDRAGGDDRAHGSAPG